MTDMIDFDSAPKNDQPTEMRDLFHLNGKTYQIPAKPRVNLALRVIKMMREHGAEAGQAMVLPDVIGLEAFDALTGYDDLTDEQMQQVVQLAMRTTMGGLEKSMGNSVRGSNK